MRRGAKDERQARARVTKVPGTSASASTSSQSPTFRLSVAGAVPKHRALPLAPVHPKGFLEPAKASTAALKAVSESASRTARRRGIRPRPDRGAERQPPHSTHQPPHAAADLRPPGMPSDEAVEAAGEFLREVDRLRKLVEERPEVFSDTKGVIVGAVCVAGIGDTDAANEVLCGQAPARGLSQCRVVEAPEEDLERLLFFVTLYRADRTPFTDLSQFLRARSDLEHTLSSSASLSEAQSASLTLVLFETTTLSTPKLLSAVEDALRAAGGTITSHPALPTAVILTTDPLEITDLRYLLFDPRGWSLIARGDIRPYQTASGWRALTRLVNLRRWLLKHFTSTEQERFLLIGSSALFMYGIRVPGDIDLYVHNPEGDQQFVAKIERALSQEEGTLFSSVDLILRGYGKWLLDGEGSEYVEALVENYFFAWPASFGAHDMNQVIRDPQFHTFFLGSKCVSLAGDVARRVRRIRPAAYADLIAIQRQGRFEGICDPIVPKITDYIFEDNQWRYLSSGERPRFFETVRLYLKNRFGKSLPVEEIATLIEGGSHIVPFRYPSGDVLQRLEEQRAGEEKRAEALNHGLKPIPRENSGGQKLPEPSLMNAERKKVTTGLRLRAGGVRGTVTVVSRVGS